MNAVCAIPQWEGDLIERIRQLWRAGKNTAEIARECGVPESEIYNILIRIRDGRAA